MIDREKQFDFIIDLLIDFDEMGFAPTTSSPDPEAYAIEWRQKITDALESYRKQSEGEWVSVKERLPEEYKNVLCFDGKKAIIAFLEMTEDCGTDVPMFWDWIAYDRDDTWDEVCATHWMPLPEPPKMKGGTE